MITYRIDKRDYRPNDVIIPQGLYQLDLTQDRLEAENILEQNRPENKPIRNSILMLFEDFEAARVFWTKSPNAKFYRTEINEEDILHTGDYNLVEHIFAAITAGNLENANLLAIDYWNGVMTDSPIVEIFVNESPVNCIISDSEKERKNERNALMKHLGYELIPGVRRITQANYP